MATVVVRNATSSDALALGVLRAGYLHARRKPRAPALIVAGTGLIDRGRDPLP